MSDCEINKNTKTKITTEEYNKKYYQEHKEQIYEKNKEAKQRARIRELLKKLNNNEYERMPNSKIEKYNIIKDKDGKYIINNS